MCLCEGWDPDKISLFDSLDVPDANDKLLLWWGRCHKYKHFPFHKRTSSDFYYAHEHHERRWKSTTEVLSTNFSSHRWPTNNWNVIEAEPQLFLSGGGGVTTENPQERRIIRDAGRQTHEYKTEKECTRRKKWIPKSRKQKMRPKKKGRNENRP